MIGPAHVLGLGTSVPGDPVPQDRILEVARALFAGESPRLDRMLTRLDVAGIATRHLVRPLSFYARPRAFVEKNQVWWEGVRELGAAAARAALADADVAPGRIGAIVAIGTTGIAAPGLDAHLIHALDLPLSILRVPLWGLGCAGGAAGIALAADLVRAGRGPVLLVAAEVCSATFLAELASEENLVAASLFGDGAAAAVIGHGERGPVLLASRSRAFPGTEAIMGWDLVDGGLRVRISRTIPTLVEHHAAELVRSVCAETPVRPEDLVHHALHPGGPRILEAYERALELEPERLAASSAILRRYGNMSSATVLFVLRELVTTRPASGAPGVLVAFGPGFSADTVTFRW